MIRPAAAGASGLRSLAARMDRLGTESAVHVFERVQRLAAEGREVLNLAVGVPDLATPEHVVEAACRALRDGHHFPTEPQGLPALRAAICDDLERRTGARIDPDCVVVVAGTKLAMLYAFALLAEPGSDVLCPDPGYSIYPSLASFFGANVVGVPARADEGFRIDPEAVLERIDARTRLVVLNSPSNPTGAVVDVEDMDRLVAGLERHPHVAVLSDEIYSRILYDGATHRSAIAYEAIRDRTILLDGFSKTYAMSGWRLGYSVWPDAWIGPVRDLQINCLTSPAAAVQIAGLAALRGPQDFVERLVRVFDERRRFLVSGLERLPGVACRPPRGAFYAFPSFPAGRPSHVLQRELLEQAGVATTAGTSFGPGGEGFLRLSYAAELGVLEEALLRMRRHLAG